MYSEHFDERPDGELHARTNPGAYTCAHIQLNRFALLAWRQSRRRVAEDGRSLDALVRDLRLALTMAPEPELRDDLQLQLAALESTVARLRQQYSLADPSSKSDRWRERSD